MKIIIRRALKEDLDEILALLYQTAQIHHKGRPDIFKDNARKYDRDEYYEILEDGTKPVFVAQDTDTGRIIGYAFCQILEFAERPVIRAYRSLYLDDLCVDESVRGEGLGTRMMNFLKDYARQTDCYNMELNVWEFNGSAVEFYSKNNMTTQRRRMEWIAERETPKNDEIV